jgi:hypothetical protein
MKLAEEFFTLQSMLTLTGAASATFVIAGVIQYIFNYNPRWLGFDADTTAPQVTSNAGPRRRRHGDHVP